MKEVNLLDCIELYKQEDRRTPPEYIALASGNTHIDDKVDPFLTVINNQRVFIDVVPLMKTLKSIGVIENDSLDYYYETGYAQPISSRLEAWVSSQLNQAGGEAKEVELNLLNAQERNEGHPFTFWTPSEYHFKYFGVGSMVKVCDTDAAERFWVRVIDIHSEEDGDIIGIVDNDTIMSKAKFGDQLKLKRCNILDIVTKGTNK